MAYIVVSVLRIQDKTHQHSLLLPWVRTTAAETQSEVGNAVESIITEVEGVALEGIPYGKRVLRVQTDRGTEWLNKAFQEAMKSRGILHTYTQGYSPQSNGTAERFVGLMKTIAKRMMVAADVAEDVWRGPWNMQP